VSGEIVDQKIEKKTLIPFNLESMIVHLVMKAKLIVFTAGKRGGNSTLWGNPPDVYIKLL